MLIRQGDPNDRRSIDEYVMYFGSNFISWTTRKQHIVSRSSTESEYKALVDTVPELMWLEVLLNELDISIKTTPVLWYDNLGVTYLIADLVFHVLTKLVEVDSTLSKRRLFVAS